MIKRTFLRKTFTKNILLFMFIGILFSSIGLAQETEVKAGVSPDQQFMWGVDLFFERVQLAFTVNAETRAELHLKNIGERIQEMRVMANRNKIQAMLKARERKEEETGELIDETDKMSEEVREHVLEQLNKHLEVLREVKQKAPEQAQEGLGNAIENAERSTERFRIETRRVEG